MRQGSAVIQNKERPMKKSQFLVVSAMATVLSMPLVLNAQSGPAPKPKFEAEKCYGVAKAGKNDCQTANSSCAGNIMRDGKADAWFYVPARSCGLLFSGPLST